VVYAAAFPNLANGSIRKSTDGGATWSTVFPRTAAIFTIIIDPGNPDVLYAPTVGHGAFKRTDGGQHWSAMAALAPQAIWTMALDPVNRQVLYAGTNQDGGLEEHGRRNYLAAGRINWVVPRVLPGR
jgi:hypothetical protein